MQTPDNRNYEYGYELAYNLAAKKLAENKDIERQCRNAGVQCQAGGSGTVITLMYLNRAYRITLPDVTVKLEGSEEAVPVRDRILILDYLNHASGKPLTGTLITYKDLPEGTVYFRTFYQRTIKPLLAHFGTEPSRLVEVGENMGGQKSTYGDASITVTAFPKVPITFVLFRGDEEFPAEGNILFDSSITDYLSVEDINVLTETITWKLVRAK